MIIKRLLLMVYIFRDKLERLEQDQGQMERLEQDQGQMERLEQEQIAFMPLMTYQIKQLFGALGIAIS